MAIVLHHTIIRSRDKHRSAAFFAELLGLAVGDPAGPFVPVRVNDDLTFDFDDRFEFLVGHYAFLVDDGTFDEVLARIEGSDIQYGSGPGRGTDRRINHPRWRPRGLRDRPRRPQLRDLHRGADVLPRRAVAERTRPRRSRHGLTVSRARPARAGRAARGRR